MKRRADVVGIFPGEAAIVRLIGAVLLEANDEWQLQHRPMQVEAMAELAPPLIEGEATPSPPSEVPPQAA
jgi:putative transposase